MSVDKIDYSVLVKVEGIIYSLGEAYKGVPVLDFNTDEAYLPVTALPPGAPTDTTIPDYFYNDDVWNEGFSEGTVRLYPKSTAELMRME